MVKLLGGDSVGIESIRYGVMCNPRLKRLSIWAYEKATILTVISLYQRKMLTSHGLKKEPFFLPWGAEISAFPFIKKIRTSELRFVHVASLNEVKDQKTLLRAFKLVSDKTSAILRIIGADNMNGKIHKLCSELDLDRNVIFLGMVPYKEITVHYAWADIMLHTSLSEGQCMALTEAAASGVLMAGTNVGVLHDLGDECGVIVDIGDYEGLAKKVLTVANDPLEWNRKVENARRWSVGHDLDWTVREFAGLLQRLVTNGKP
jgi:glycosyltransferase involved in cell wall biosynthesis